MVFLSEGVMTTDAYDFPDASGHFGPYGGLFVSETPNGALPPLRQAPERLLG